MYQSNYLVKSAIKDSAKAVTLAGENNLAIVEALVKEALVEYTGSYEHLSNHELKMLILEGMAEGMKN